MVTAPGVCPKLEPCRVGSGRSRSALCLSFPPPSLLSPPGVSVIRVCQHCAGQQCGTAAPSPGISGTPKCSHTTPLTQPPAAVQGDAADPAQKKKKSQKGGGKNKKTPKPHGEAEGADGPQLRGPRAAGGSGFMLPTCHEMRVGHCGNSKFQMALFGWVFFPLPHFQGNKTRCHLLVAIEISPDSASAEEKAGRAHCC